MAAVKRVIQGLWQPAKDNNSSTDADVFNLYKDDLTYEQRIEAIREVEYPTLVGTTYLDHAGTTPYAKSLVENWTSELTTNLFGNPHSASAASQLSTRRIDDIRFKVLHFFKADPDDFDVVFVANATAAIKLVTEAFRDGENGFWFGYHNDAHTSLVGCREVAQNGSRCFESDQAVEEWMSNSRQVLTPNLGSKLFAYPGQSNLNGRKLPLTWSRSIRQNASLSRERIYTLLDAASLVATSPLDLSDATSAPDFTALSFYKIFGLPDLGGLLVRKSSSQVFAGKHYFAGGTVDAVINLENVWHAKKTSLHAMLEEGTIPFHNILALDHAISIHQNLFGSMENVSHHTRALADKARKFLRQSCHANGAPVCEVYGDSVNEIYGPIIVFNLRDSAGDWVSASEVDKLSIVKGLQLRTGGMCNPGGIAHHLNLNAPQIRSNYEAGYRCGGESDLFDNRPTGAIRISFGAMSTKSDLDHFIRFIEEYYIERNILAPPSATLGRQNKHASYFVESIAVFPIKSCAAYKVPPDQPWLVTNRGLAWDREWCLVHEGTNAALSQKKYPRLSLLRPMLKLEARKLEISYSTAKVTERLEIDIDEVPSTIIASPGSCPKSGFKMGNSKVCGDTVPLHIHTSKSVNGFFSQALGVPCCLARYSRTDTTRKANLRRPDMETLGSSSPLPSISSPSQLMLSNESPILIVSASSVNELNRQIRRNAWKNPIPLDKVKTISADSFRGNIVMAQHVPADDETPYVEDEWKSATIGTITKNPPPPLEDLQHTGESSPTNSAYSLSSASDTTDVSKATTRSMPGSFETADTNPDFVQEQSAVKRTLQPAKLNILGPCQRCQIVSIDQQTAKSQLEPFSTLAKTRRKGDGRVWFGVHAALDLDAGLDPENVYIQIGDPVNPQLGGR